MGRRFEAEDRLTVHGLVQPLQQSIGISEQELDELPLVRTTRALFDHGGHDGDAVELEQRDRILRFGAGFIVIHSGRHS